MKKALVSIGLAVVLLAGYVGFSRSNESWSAFYVIGPLGDQPSISEQGFSSFDQCKRYLIELDTNNAVTYQLEQAATSFSGLDDNDVAVGNSYCGLNCENDDSNYPRLSTCEKVQSL